jgi:cytochrome c553
MNRKQLIALAGLVVAAAFAAWLAWSGRQPPLLPSNEPHAIFQNAAACLTCHGPDGPAPRSAEHPLGDDCLRCHGRR